MSFKTTLTAFAVLISLSVSGYGQSNFFEFDEDAEPSRGKLVETMNRTKRQYDEFKRRNPDYDVFEGERVYAKREQLANQQAQLRREQTEIRQELQALDVLAGEIARDSVTLDPSDGRDVLGGVPVENDPGKRARELLDGPGGRKPDLDEKREEYRDRLYELNQRILRLNQKSRDFADASEQLYRDEQELGFTEPYEVPVVSLRRRSTESRSRTRMDEDRVDAVESSQLEAAAVGRWETGIHNSQQGAYQVSDFNLQPGGKASVHYWRSPAGYSWSGFDATWQVQGNTLTIRSAGATHTDVSFVGTIEPNRIVGTTIIGAATNSDDSLTLVAAPESAS